MTSHNGFFLEFMNLHFFKSKSFNCNRLSIANVKSLMFLLYYLNFKSRSKSIKYLSLASSFGLFLIYLAIFLISSLTRTSFNNSVRYSPDTISSCSKNKANLSYDGFKCNCDFKLQNNSCPTTKGFKSDLSRRSS